MTGDWGPRASEDAPAPALPDHAAPGHEAPVPAEPGHEAPAPAVPGHGVRPRRRWGLGLALVLALLASAALAFATWWLASAQQSWESQNTELREQVDALTDELTVRNARLAELEEAQTQLDNLKEQYSAAVNQGAAGTEIVEELEDIVAAYQRCVDAQADHFDVLRNAEQYVPSSIVDSEASITSYCAEVSLAYADFQASRG